MAEISNRYFCPVCKRPFHPKYPPRWYYDEIQPCGFCLANLGSQSELDRVSLAQLGPYALP